MVIRKKGAVAFLAVLLLGTMACSHLHNDGSPETVVLTEAQTSRLFELAELGAPLSSVETEVVERDGVTHRISSQRFQLEFRVDVEDQLPPTLQVAAVKCVGTCTAVSEGCGTTSGCDPDGNGGCTAIQCGGGCTGTCNTGTVEVPTEIPSVLADSSL